MENLKHKLIGHRNFIFLGVFLTGLLFGAALGPGVIDFITTSNCASDFKMINPEPDCETSERAASNLSALQTSLEASIQSYKDNKEADRVGVFVRDLNSRKSTGVNDSQIFYLTSLLKTPLAISGYKLAEVEPQILKQAIRYSGTPDLYDMQIIQPQEKLIIGRVYTVEELIRRSIVYSDNTAAQILFDYYPKGFIDHIMQALGIQLQRPSNMQENITTPRSYASVFTTLYNSSYLTREYSDKVLSLLAQSSFAQGATAKLPKNTQVAHKFGERTIVNSRTGQTLRQLHDCGIVYDQNNLALYNFCIMTEGTDYSKLEDIIQNISLKIYENLMRD